MSAAEIKKTRTKLISWIEQLSDPNVLDFLDGIIQSNTKKDWFDELSLKQQNHLNEGLEDIKNGKVMSSDQFWNNLILV
jgi:hypothetical protein